ncbi:hypothetical protein predicted by Glimmer/Critica [Sorangium cellulosum So ce56]|uniref:Uncharacterized protein n=1 Tax=Sorangium cellulosum (strain So ce56) TaxID=448385 RepID=A9ERD4_SORC5|nr:hypothetical protein predicted by Glimmer/Critica [Sorangium cellulosum So ce56]
MQFRGWKSTATLVAEPARERRRGETASGAKIFITNATEAKITSGEKNFIHDVRRAPSPSSLAPRGRPGATRRAEARARRRARLRAALRARAASAPLERAHPGRRQRGPASVDGAGRSLRRRDDEVRDAPDRPIDMTRLRGLSTWRDALFDGFSDALKRARGTRHPAAPSPAPAPFPHHGRPRR